MKREDHGYDSAEALVHCTVHPDREATLHCNKCGSPMCIKCAVLTPVGYRCKACVRGIESTYYNATAFDDLLAFVVAGVAGLVLAALARVLPLPYFMWLVIGFPVGALVVELIIWTVQRHHSRTMHYVAATGAALGGLLVMLVLRAFTHPGVWLAVGSVVLAIYYRMKMRG
ncbi:MAG: B-box zinc finger protein [Anaerolineae bacterium]|nr:B-box zinc finger protein [Anaerolineae bacterium]